MKILVIDDWRAIAESIKKYFPDASVDHEYWIPTDLSKLDNYDILVVDNQGIGNGKWNSGEAFLKDYKATKPNQMVIFHSGLSPRHEFAEILKSKGFFSFTKGRNPDELVALVKENFNNE
jgi:DNA-binding response OmpR family regulator